MTNSHVSCDVSLRVRNSYCPNIHNIHTSCVQNGSDVFVVRRSCPARGSIEQVQSGRSDTVHQYGELVMC